MDVIVETGAKQYSNAIEKCNNLFKQQNATKSYQSLYVKKQIK